MTSVRLAAEIVEASRGYRPDEPMHIKYAAWIAERLAVRLGEPSGDLIEQALTEIWEISDEEGSIYDLSSREDVINLATAVQHQLEEIRARGQRQERT